jgi:hypothetical protein
MLTRHCVCRLQVLYSAVMVPWSIAFTLHESCDAPGARHDGCIPASLKARARRRSVAQRLVTSIAGCRLAPCMRAGELTRHATLRRCHRRWILRWTCASGSTSPSASAPARAHARLRALASLADSTLPPE